MARECVHYYPYAYKMERGTFKGFGVVGLDPTEEEEADQELGEATGPCIR